MLNLFFDFYFFFSVFVCFFLFFLNVNKDYTLKYYCLQEFKFFTLLELFCQNLKFKVGKEYLFF